MPAAGSMMVVPGCGAHDFDNGVNQDARSEVLTGAGFGILRVLFEQAFVDVTLDIGAESAPRFLVDEIDDETGSMRLAQLYSSGMLDLRLYGGRVRS